MAIVKQRVQVLPGHRVELVAPELNDRDWVEAVVNSGQTPVITQTSPLAFIDSLPPGPRAAPNWEQYETQLQQDRQSWDQ